MPAKTHVRTFTKERETPNTIRFKEEPTKGEPPIVGSLYLQKWIANDATQVKVTLEIG